MQSDNAEPLAARQADCRRPGFRIWTLDLEARPQCDLQLRAGVADKIGGEIVNGGKNSPQPSVGDLAGFIAEAEEVRYRELRCTCGESCLAASTRAQEARIRLEADAARHRRDQRGETLMRRIRCPAKAVPSPSRPTADFWADLRRPAHIGKESIVARSPVARW